MFCSWEGPVYSNWFLILSGGEDAQWVSEGRPLQSPADVLLRVQEVYGKSSVMTSKHLWNYKVKERGRIRSRGNVLPSSFLLWLLAVCSQSGQKQNETEIILYPTQRMIKLNSVFSLYRLTHGRGSEEGKDIEDRTLDICKYLYLLNHSSARLTSLRMCNLIWNVSKKVGSKGLPNVNLTQATWSAE